MVTTAYPSRVLTYHAERPFLLLDDVTANTDDPGSLTPIYVLQQGTDLRTLVSYTGALTTVNLKLWLHAAGAPNGTFWYQGEEVALDPADGPIALDWPLGDPTRFHIQVTNLTGAGGITVLAYHIALGSGSRRA
jgi:hypothetical protein